MSKYFKRCDLECPCGCNKTIVNSNFLDMLDNARKIAGIPFLVVNGFICENIVSRKCCIDNEAHNKGLAIDIFFKNQDMHDKITSSLKKVGFKCVKINQKKGIIHVAYLE